MIVIDCSSYKYADGEVLRWIEMTKIHAVIWLVTTRQAHKMMEGKRPGRTPGSYFYINLLIKTV